MKKNININTKNVVKIVDLFECIGTLVLLFIFGYFFLKMDADPVFTVVFAIALVINIIISIIKLIRILLGKEKKKGKINIFKNPLK